MLLPGGGHVLPVLHRGHVELPPGDVLELSSGNAVSRHLCIAGDDFEPAGPSAQACQTHLYPTLASGTLFLQSATKWAEGIGCAHPWL